MMRAATLAAATLLTIVVLITTLTTTLASAVLHSASWPPPPHPDTGAAPPGPPAPHGRHSPPPTADCAPTRPPGAALAGYQPDQITHATTIITVGKRLNIPPRGWVIALAAALTESGLHNLPHGDHDSLGLFQQRPSQGWGSPAQILDPTHAATAFYRHLMALPGWRAMSVTDAAQAVQRSATPTAFARHEPAARALAHALAPGNTTCAPTHRDPSTHRPHTPDPQTPAPSPAAAAAAAFATTQIGTPYRWGGDGPTEGGWDCSGLTRAAYAATGITIPRTAQTQYDNGPRLAPGTAPQPGDLLFYGTSPTHITHVTIATTPTHMIHAPHRGSLVKIDPIPRANLIGMTRPAPAPGAP